MSKLGSALLAAIFVVASSVMICARADDVALLGTGLGAAAGGLFGSQFGHGAGQFAATGIGVVAGGLIGNDVARAIDESPPQNRGARNGYAIYAAPAPVAYNSYVPNYVAPPAPPPTYIDEEAGTFCRPYSQEINIAGRWQESYGTACLEPDGTCRAIQ